MVHTEQVELLATTQFPGDTPNNKDCPIIPMSVLNPRRLAKEQASFPMYLAEPVDGVVVTITVAGTEVEVVTINSFIVHPAYPTQIPTSPKETEDIAGLNGTSIVTNRYKAADYPTGLLIRGVRATNGSTNKSIAAVFQWYREV
jgi:hypothetical protein